MLLLQTAADVWFGEEGNSTTTNVKDYIGTFMIFRWCNLEMFENLSSVVGVFTTVMILT